MDQIAYNRRLFLSISSIMIYVSIQVVISCLPGLRRQFTQGDISIGATQKLYIQKDTTVSPVKRVTNKPDSNNDHGLFLYTSEFGLFIKSDSLSSSMVSFSAIMSIAIWIEVAVLAVCGETPVMSSG